MASFASVKPPFAYDPTCKPTKSILKHRGTSQGTATSWLSRLSLNDLTATSPTAAPLTQRSSLGFFNFRRNVQVSPPTTTPPDASLPSSPDNPALKHASLDELAPEELKRVRFPVDHLTTEFYPYGPSPLANEDDTSRSEKENTQPPSSIKCQTPQELLTVYETACRNKEEPTLDKLVTMLITCQHMDHLTTIDLSNQAIYRRSAEPLADLLSLDFRLKKLILNNCALEDDVIKILLHGLLLKDQLEELSLANNKKIRGAGFKYIAIYTKTSTALRKLDLSFTTPDKKSIQHLAHGIESSSLHTLRMNSCSLRPPQLEVLANGIRQSRSLRHVSLCDNRITHQGALWIGVMLRDYDGHVFSQGLTELALDHNDIRQGIQYIAQALRRNQSLRSLSLQDCKLDSKGCALIGEALKYNQSLENLNISFNGLNAPSIEGIQALKRALYVNRSLKELSLAASGLGSEAAVELAESLPENKALVRLDLSKNEAMDLAGLLALAAGVRINYSIVFLDVSVPGNDRDMGRTQSDIVATCTRNAQHASQNSVADTTKPTLTRSSSQNSHDPLNQITTAQATARLTLQERLAAVTRSQIARSPSIRSTTSSSENKWLKSQPQAVEIATRQVGLLEEMLAAETGRRRESNELLPASDIMTQLYQQCRDTQTEHQLKIPNITDTAELALLLGLNDRLLAAIAMYDSLYPAKAEPKLQDISTSTDMPPISDTLDLSGSFEIGDAEDDDDDDVRHMMDAETTINSNEKQANLNAESAHTETEGDEHTDMAELRRVIEVEEGVAFKQAKNTGL